MENIRLWEISRKDEEVKKRKKREQRNNEKQVKENY